jgi:hypothetical protein
MRSNTMRASFVKSCKACRTTEGLWHVHMWGRRTWEPREAPGHREEAVGTPVGSLPGATGGSRLGGVCRRTS